MPWPRGCVAGAGRKQLREAHAGDRPQPASSWEGLKWVSKRSWNGRDFSGECKDGEG